jgi:hypothetical protein
MVRPANSSDSVPMRNRLRITRSLPFGLLAWAGVEATLDIRAVGVGAMQALSLVMLALSDVHKGNFKLKGAQEAGRCRGLDFIKLATTTPRDLMIVALQKRGVKALHARTILDSVIVALTVVLPAVAPHAADVAKTYSLSQSPGQRLMSGLAEHLDFRSRVAHYDDLFGDAPSQALLHVDACHVHAHHSLVADQEGLRSTSHRDGGNDDTSVLLESMFHSTGEMAASLRDERERVLHEARGRAWREDSLAPELAGRSLPGPLPVQATVEATVVHARVLQPQELKTEPEHAGSGRSGLMAVKGAEGPADVPLSVEEERIKPSQPEPEARRPLEKMPQTIVPTLLVAGTHVQ